MFINMRERERRRERATKVGHVILYSNSFRYCYFKNKHSDNDVLYYIKGSQCKPLPPNCHPHCIKYDVAHCRLCMCESGKSLQIVFVGKW